MNYNSLMNKPTINYRELIGDNTVTEVGGITEEQFNTLLNTDLSSYYTKAQIDDLFSRSYVFRDKSGGIVTFDCPSSTPAFYQIGSEIKAVQSGTGDPSPTNIRPISGWSAVNVVNMNDVTDIQYFKGLLLGTYGFVDLGSLTWNHTSQNRSISNAIANIIKKPATQTSLANIITSNGYTEVPSNTSLSINSQFAISQSGDMIFYYDGVNEPKGYMVYELATPTTPTITDEQFNSLLTAFGISGTTYTTQLKDGQGNPMTCYGGGLMNAGGNQALLVTKGHIASYNGETLPSTWESDRDVYAEGTTPSIGAEVVYELETPLQIPQDSLSIVSTGGINNIWCDTGDITVKALDRIIQG